MSTTPATPTRPGNGRGRSQNHGDHLVWLTGGALAICLFMVFAVIGIIVWNGAPFFWPHEVTLYRMKDGRNVLAMLRSKEVIPPAQAREQNLTANPHRRLVMVGNRDEGTDFVWMNDADIVSESNPADAWVLERHEYGDFIGFVKGLNVDGRTLDADEAQARLPAAIAAAQGTFSKIRRIERYDIGSVNASIEKCRLARVHAERTLQGAALTAETKRLDDELTRFQRDYNTLVSTVATLRTEGKRSVVTLETADGKLKEAPLLGIVGAWRPNAMGFGSKVGFYLDRLMGFFWDDPREANTEGGVFPAMIGTAIMVILMSLAAVPFGVLTAFYLCEYARQGPVVRAVRIAINNLAGVPSIVYGVFGLGFFVYFVGGGIDRVFYSDALPTPTWGTGGVLWASLTLALLTVPVVVMATEESIMAIPRGMREGSLALGASKLQTLRRILLPAAMPGILTGMILAMARGTGEVAPLMITGVVKLAPSLPVDGSWPFFHLERKFMHLGFHIYDVGFQSPNVEASRPMVFTSALLLIALVILLNLGAILLRDYVRRRYTTGAFH